MYSRRPFNILHFIFTTNSSMSQETGRTKLNLNAQPHYEVNTYIHKEKTFYSFRILSIALLYLIKPLVWLCFQA